MSVDDGLAGARALVVGGYGGIGTAICQRLGTAAGSTLTWHAYLSTSSFGGGKMPVSVIAKAMELLPGMDFTNAYGLTETSSTICLLNPEDHRRAMASGDPEA